MSGSTKHVEKRYETSLFNYVLVTEDGEYQIKREKPDNPIMEPDFYRTYENETYVGSSPERSEVAAILDATIKDDFNYAGIYLEEKVDAFVDGEDMNNAVKAQDELNRVSNKLGQELAELIRDDLNQNQDQ